MVEIEIMPATRCEGGWYIARGHAGPGNELICNTVTAIEECLGANLDNTWDIRVKRRKGDGIYELRWNKSDRKGAGIPRSNLAAGFALTGLRALAKEYPELVKVEWKRRERKEDA